MGLGGRTKELAPQIFSCVKSVRVRVIMMISLAGLTGLTLLTSPFLFWQPTRLIVKSVKYNGKAGIYSFMNYSNAPLNETLLAFSAIEPNQEQERHQIKKLLDGSLDGGRNRRNIWVYNNRDRRDHYHDVEDRRRPVRNRGNQNWPLQLSSPKYAPYWPKFRELLNSWVLSKRFEPKVMQGLVSTIKLPVDNHYKAERQHKYETCAVVGNSGILLNRSYGSIIDAHEMVMRLNNAKTAGYEQFVGKKTTIAFVNSNILHQCSRRVRCFCHPYGENVPIVMYICQVVHFMDVALCSAAHKSPLLVTDPRFDSLAARIVKWYSVKDFVEETGRSVSEWSSAHDGLSFHYSSGMQAVMLALAICNEVNLFGFGKLNETKHHYHTSQKAELSLHDYEAEYKFYDDLVNKRIASIPFLNEAGINIPPMYVFR